MKTPRIRIISLRNGGIATMKNELLFIYKHFEYFLSEIQNHIHDTKQFFLENLLSWSASLPVEIKKR